MKLTNFQMEAMVMSITQDILERSDIIGYTAARNYRLLFDALTEYFKIKDRLIFKYGNPHLDNDGNDTGKYYIDNNSPKFKQYSREITPIGKIEHDVDVFTIPFTEAIGAISGKELLSIDWMFKDERKECRNDSSSINTNEQ